MSLAPFRSDRLSLPPTGAGCPRLERILPGDALSYLKGYHERMLASSDEVAGREPAGCYMDPVLSFNQKKYQGLVKILASKCLLEFVRVSEVQERIGLFCVLKSDGVRQRLIVDARRADRRFKCLPPWGC